LTKCPACSHTKGRDYRPEKFHGEVRECARCGAIFTYNGAAIYVGESYLIVSPWFVDEGQDTPEVNERARYYDLTCLGSKGITRRHGWFDPQTKRITQVG